jgi:hypothetical protein
MSELEGSKSFTTFQELSGISVSVSDVVSEISRLPLDGVLGFSAGLSLEMIQAKENFFSSELQGSFLQLAIVDEFPQKIAQVSQIYIPGRVPMTGGRHIFVHEQNLAWLSHAALLHSNRDSNTPEITHELRCRLFRLLLIINDLLSVEREPQPINFIARRNFAHAWLRHGQFNRLSGHSIEILLQLARQKIILQNILPKFFTDLESDFESAAGVGLQRYFEILTLFITHFYEGMKKGQHWLSKETLCSQIGAKKDDIEVVLRRWIRSPQQYSIACKKWRDERPDMGDLPNYDFVSLRETPFIEARNGELVCPVPTLLFAKIEDEPFFILSDFLSGKKLTQFHVATGSAYEEYANHLVERLARADIGGQWRFIPSPRTKKGEQLTDSYLQRGEVAVVFEHKGQRPGTEFLRGGEGDRVVGPKESFLKRFDDQQAVTVSKGLLNDEGYITRGMWQQSKSGPKIISWAKKEIGSSPDRLFPVITHLSPLRVDSVILRSYLKPLIQTANLYNDNFWEQPQWLHISDLESLAQIAEDGLIDVEALLDEKSYGSVDKRFDIFLYEYLDSRTFIDERLKNEALALLKNAKVSFFGESFENASLEHEIDSLNDN